MTMEKTELIKAVLQQRKEAARKGYRYADGWMKPWLAGKIGGYEEAIELLDSSEKSIEVECGGTPPIAELEYINGSGVEIR